ncbi:MAG: PD40 domain-containing protein [Chloroflexi bacterium]|nr:PD40 domain-containing protein [Chloroflexota bacterium]
MSSYHARMSEWSRHARLANASASSEGEELELDRIVQSLKAQHVSMIERDSRRSDWDWLTFDTHEDGAPSWSPDRQRIAFETHQGVSPQTPTALWRIRAPNPPLSLHVPIVFRAWTVRSQSPL